MGKWTTSLIFQTKKNILNNIRNIKEKTHFTDEYFRFIPSLNQCLEAFFEITRYFQLFKWLIDRLKKYVGAN